MPIYNAGNTYFTGEEYEVMHYIMNSFRPTKRMKQTWMYQRLRNKFGVSAGAPRIRQGQVWWNGKYYLIIVGWWCEAWNNYPLKWKVVKDSERDWKTWDDGELRALLITKKFKLVASRIPVSA